MMMIVYKSISFLFVLFCDRTLHVNAIYVILSGNKVGLLGDNGTELECLYTQGNFFQFIVSFMAFNKSGITFETIATYIPDQTPLLNTNGQYLKGRVAFTPITQFSTKAVMTFNKLMCIDDTFYQCAVSYLDSNGNHYPISNNISISVQVPPSKPDSISILHTPADSLKPIKTDDNDTTTSTSSKVDFSIPGIAEGDSITVICAGDVGKPPAKHIFQKLLFGQIVPMQVTVTATSISEISENCSYYRTSNLTFQVTADDNNAVIRCVVNSSMEEPDIYVETAPIEVYSNEAPPTTFRSSVSNKTPVIKQSNNKNTAAIVVGTVCGSIILVLCVVLFGVLQNKNKTLGCLLIRNRNDRSLDYVNTTQQHYPSLYEGVDHALDVHNYEQLSRREHLYNNANFSNN